MTACLKGTAEVTQPQLSIAVQCLACSEESLLTQLALWLKVSKAKQAVQYHLASGNVSHIRKCTMMYCYQACGMPTLCPVQ